MEIIINNKIFKQYKDTDYYASRDGDIYSSRAHKIIHGQISLTRGKQYRRIDIKDEKTGIVKHVNVHKIVFVSWVRDIRPDEQINHKNDDSLDNRLENLYAGSQKENIADCVSNGHRVGNVFYLTLYDKEKNKTITFCPASDFIRYSGHPSKNGNVTKMMRKNWFKVRYQIIDFKRVKNIDDYDSIRSVTTSGDECNRVG